MQMPWLFTQWCYVDICVHLCSRKCVCVCARVFRSFGLWKIVAKFGSKPQLSFSSEFEVKEYGESERSSSFNS